jgi:ribose transport system ATP-binding protein
MQSGQVMPNSPPTVPALELLNISKAFPGVKALTDVNMRVFGGQVHALLGENGAGKSTLLKILSGLILADTGTVHIDGELASLLSPKAARNAGIAMIHQELQQVPELSVAQNMFLGRTLAWGHLINNNSKMRDLARQQLAKLDPTVDVTAKIGNLPVAQRQLVEIAKATLFEARIIAMDEPTSSLTPREFEKLATVIADLAKQGVAIIYVSHKLDEVYRVAESATVLRDGRLVQHVDLTAVDEAQLVNMMVGRPLDVRHRNSFAKPNLTLEVSGLTRGNAVRDVDLAVHQGEVLGIAGLVGSGRTELVKLIAGIDQPTAGTLKLGGKTVRFKSPREAIQAGIALLPEDRKKEGIVPLRSVRSNAAMPSYRTFAPRGIVQTQRLKAETLKYAKRVNLRPVDTERRIMLFSGGNQQKAILMRWLMAQARVMIFDEPTRGIDVGAKEEIYQLIEQLAADGHSIIVVSSELSEILRVSDRILVMKAGAAAGVLNRDQANQENIMALAFSNLSKGAA